MRKCSAGPSLSPRERQVLACLIEGHQNKVIAAMLGMSEGTVKVHVKHLMRKIGVDTRTKAARWGMEHFLDQRKKPSKR